MNPSLRRRFALYPETVPFPFAANSPRQGAGFLSEDIDAQVHLLLTPDEFLTATGVFPKYVKIMIEPAATKLAAKIVDGQTPIPNLNIAERNGGLQVIGHEGRHRAFASKLLGVKLIPVRVVIYSATGSRWAEWSKGPLEAYPPVAAWLAGKSVSVIPQTYGSSFNEQWGHVPLRSMKLRMR